jgi:hypothetical protein
VLGTATYVEHNPRGVDWVLLFNASKGQPEGPEFYEEFRRNVHAAIESTTQWPEMDLFDRYR